MQIPLYYIMTDPTLPPFITKGFRAYMASVDGVSYVPCWKDNSKAIEYLKNHFGTDSNFVIVPSTVELLQSKMMAGVGRLFEIRFMD
jgi:hypothetical protein